MTNDIKVSIVTVSYNSANTIRRTIESVIGQTYNNIEYIIIDGASKDDTTEIIRSYADSNAKIRWISEEDNGIYDAMNKGIRMCTGDLIGILNSDDWYEPDAVEIMVNNYESEKYLILYGMIRNFRGDEAVSAGWTSHTKLRQEMIAHPACFISRKLYEDLGVYDTEYRYAADYDFMLRMMDVHGIVFKPVFDIVTNFSLGGSCSSGKAWIELVNIRYRYGIINKKEYQKIMAKDLCYRIYKKSLGKYLGEKHA